MVHNDYWRVRVHIPIQQGKGLIYSKVLIKESLFPRYYRGRGSLG